MSSLQRLAGNALLRVGGQFMLLDFALADFAIDDGPLEHMQHELLRQRLLLGIGAFTVTSNDSPATNTGRTVLKAERKPLRGEEEVLHSSADSARAA